MAGVLIIGDSGTGKSTSIETLDPARTLIINVESKTFPFGKQFKYVMETDDIDKIIHQMQNMGGIKTVVIDDAGYLMTNAFMRGHSGGRKGSQVFDLYNDIGDSFWNLIEFINKGLPKDVLVYLMMHLDESDSGRIRPKTIGKMLDDKVCVEGMFTICLRCESKDGKHYFRTVTNGYDPVKAPKGMFDSDTIPNDLAYVDAKIREYYGYNNTKTA